MSTKSEFKWGIEKSVGRKNSDFRFYESFFYDGEEYSLYDSVVLYRDGDLETYVGKLVRMYETPEQEKRVKIVWYFRPTEIRNFLDDYRPKANELLLASGEGKGLYNINSPYSIVTKCNVLCASNDRRNPRVSNEELCRADYIFSRTFDVAKLKIEERFPEKIAGVKVENFFNTKKDKALATVSESKRTAASVEKQRYHPSENTASRPTSPVAKLKIGKNFAEKGDEAKDSRNAVTGTVKQWHCSTDNATLKPNIRANVRLLEDITQPSASDMPLKKRKLLQDGTVSKEFDELVQNKDSKTDSLIPEVARRPNSTWEEKLQKANESGMLVLLENLDPCYTSSEVEDLVWQAFNEKVEAKMLQRSAFSNPHYGKALVIFKSKDRADFAKSELMSRYLIVADGRPVIGGRTTLVVPGTRPTRLTGHLTLHKLRQKQSQDMKKAVSTSHCSQPNTIEHEMAAQWRLIQEQADVWWKALYELIQMTCAVNAIDSQMLLCIFCALCCSGYWRPHVSHMQ
ncbi:protein ANTI-SILENCING 1 [Citrus sinensis]|uniref:Protein ANTI-SILENCING 1 n=1 Tax=Citrus sinensis TaxID=2711 RepID=A0ACB8JC57_CITSI|nr:protein ANTI-SILENCING 1 [Citrus sinensis]